MGPRRGAARAGSTFFFSTLIAQKARAAVVYRGRDRVATSLGGPDALTNASRERFDALIDSLAVISLAWPHRQRREDIARALAERGVDLTDLLARLDERSRDHGSALVLATSDLLLAAV